MFVKYDSLAHNIVMTLTWLKILVWLFYLFIFLLPWQTRWIVRDLHIWRPQVPSGVERIWEYGRISLYSWDIIFLLLIIVSWPMIWREIKDLKIRNPKSEILNNSQISNFKIIYLVLLCLSFLSIIWSSDKVLAAVWNARLLEGGLLWLLIKTIKPKLLGIFWSLTLAGAIQALWGIVQFFTQSTFANKWLGVAAHSLTQAGTSVILSGGENWLRAYGGQVHPNVLGGLLVVTCLATIWLYFIEKSEIRNPKSEINPNDQKFSNFEFRYSNLKKIILFSLYIIQLAGLFFTFSRGAWLALGVSLIIWWWQSRCHPGRGSGIQKQIETQKADSFLFLDSRLPLGHELEAEWRGNDSSRWRNVLIITTSVFIILSAVYYPLVQTRIFGGGRLEQQSVEERVGSVKDSQSILARVWWRGTGMDNYTVELQKIQPNLSPRFYQPVHNMFLLVFTELGIVGLIIFIWLLWIGIRSLVLRHWIFVTFSNTQVTSSYWLVAIIITAMFDHYWWTIPSMFMLFWLILALVNLESDTKINIS